MDARDEKDGGRGAGSHRASGGKRTRGLESVAARHRPAARVRAEVIYARAITLARAGKYSRAQRLVIVGLEETPGSERLLELMARIYVQCGLLDEAERLWRRPGQSAPGKEVSVAALARLEEFRARTGRPADGRPGRPQVVRSPLLAVIAGVLVALTFLMIRGFSRAPASSPKKEQAAAATHGAAVPPVGRPVDGQSRASAGSSPAVTETPATQPQATAFPPTSAPPR